MAFGRIENHKIFKAMRKKSLLLLFGTVLSLFSCSKIELFLSEDGQETLKERDIEGIMVPQNNLLFSKLPQLSGIWATKSGEAADNVSLSSLLDWEKLDTCHFKNKIVTQVPFLPDKEGDAVSLTDTLKNEIFGGDITVVKKYLIEVVEKGKAGKERFVATLIPTAECLNIFGEDGFSFFDKSVFEGIVLYSELDGRFIDIYIYGSESMKYGIFVDKDKAEDYGRLLYLRLVYDKPSTKGTQNDEVDGGEITPSICIATVEVKEEEEESDLLRHGGGGGGGRGGGGGGGGLVGGGGSAGELDGGMIKSAIVSAFKKDPLTFRVSLHKEGEGTLRGAGIYPKGSFVLCNAMPKLGSYLDRWTGDFSGNQERILFMIRSDVSATAYFRKLIERPDRIRPCEDLKRGVGNPLMSMSVASTGKASGLKGGTYGKVRYNEDGTKKFHGGIDLSAPIGTAAYAMIDGVIDEVGKKPKRYVTEQPNIKSGRYPTGYQGDKNGAGNRVNIVGNFNGQEVRIGYWHLRASDPVAINPRTGKPFAPGDRIYRGEVLCYTGITGNAYNVPNPHLHLAFYEKDARGKYVNVNPEKIINGKVDWDEEGKKILSPQIKEAICDEGGFGRIVFF